MPDPITTIALVILTLVSAWASVVALRGLWRTQRPPTPDDDNRDAARAAPSSRRDQLQHTLIGLVAAGCTALFLYRWMAVHETWQPLESHLDGLLLLTALVGMMVWYLTARSRLPALGAFALPLITLVLAWAICASTFTFREFDFSRDLDIATAWRTVHLAGVYLGTIFFAIAALAGGMYLYVQRQLRRKQSPGTPGRFTSLESLETLIVRSATLGFAVLTLGLVTGLIVVSSGPTAMGPQWWLSPKFILAAAAWVIYALVMNVRHTTSFRGARAAWLAICGLVLLLATFGVVSAMSAGHQPEPTGQRDPAPPAQGPAGADSPRQAPPPPDAAQEVG